MSPWLNEGLVRLGAWMPFEKAAALLEAFTRVRVEEFTARQHGLAAGAAYVRVQTTAVEQLEHAAPPAPPGPAKQFLSADGAFVPLVGGKWGEVKTLAIGEVGEPVQEKGEWVVHTDRLSYFSRLADAETFTRLALVETHRRGVENAGQVGAILDGAEWLQGLVDHHRPDAVRILDFPHAGGYVAKIGQATFGADTPELAAWLHPQLHALKHQGPDDVLVGLREMVEEHPNAESLELPKALAYLEKRTAQMRYPAFQAAGWPIGSGPMESGNKSVVTVRLRGAGMHWAPGHVDPMLALRNIVCNDRWAETWPLIEAQLRRQAREHRAARRQQRQTARTQAPPCADLPQVLSVADPAPVLVSCPASPPAPEPPAGQSERLPHRPAPNHPWRHAPIGRACYRSAQDKPAGKL